MHVIIGGEIERAATGNEQPRLNVAVFDCSLQSTIARKKGTLVAVVGGEIQFARDDGEIGWAGTIRILCASERQFSRIEVFHHHGARRRTIALPQFVPIYVVVGGKEQRAIDVR